MVSRGKFIVFEGCDRSGKTSQCNLVVDALKKKNVRTEYLKFPERSTDVGCIINDYLTGKLNLTDQQIHFLFSLNRKELMTSMESKLKEGCTLIVDRYSFSGIAYSSIKQGMDLTFCCLTELGLLKPDLVLYLNASLEVSSGREGFGEEVYEKKETQLRVREAYQMPIFSCMQVIDGEGSVEEVNQRVLECLDSHQASATTTAPFQYYSRQHFNLHEEAVAKVKVVEDVMNKCMLVVEEMKKKGEDKKVLLQSLVELLTSVQC